MISRLVIDSTHAMSELCMLGRMTGTDKTPFNAIGHRHPYTAVYTMLFAPMKSRPIRFAEIGVAGGASGLMWDAYFTNPETQICLFDRDINFLANVQHMTSSRVRTEIMDVSSNGDIARALTLAAADPAGQYDVILDDSSHIFEDQIRIAHEALPLLKPGGMFIIEDIFRAREEADYIKALGGLLEHCSAAYFVVCEHAARWSPGWDNDKLLVLVRG